MSTDSVPEGANPTRPGPSRTGRLMGLPLGLIAAVAVLGTALVSVILLKAGIADRRGGLIAVGVLLGAFWLMFLAQTVATVGRQFRTSSGGESNPSAGADDSEADRDHESSSTDA